MNSKVVIGKRFCGPPDSGNGGYVCGVMAGYIDDVAEVTLRQPPPLDKPMSVERVNAGRIILRDGEAIVAEAKPATLELDVPSPPSFHQASEASRSYLGFEYHPFPTCFVCGTDRDEADGLRIFAGKNETNNMVSAPWVPDQGLADNEGHIRPEFLWSALDCPGYFAAINDDFVPILLGRLTARIHLPVTFGEECVVIGWQIRKDGRKHHIGTALFSSSGELCGYARATWIQVDKLSI